MFNTTVNRVQIDKGAVQFNATSTGHIQRSHGKSWFARAQLGSSWARQVLSENPCLKLNGQYEPAVRVVVIQMVIHGDDWAIFELARAESFGVSDGGES